MAPSMSKNQKKNLKRAQIAKAAETEDQQSNMLLQLEVRKMLVPTLEASTSKIAQHEYGALAFQARKMLFPSWDLNGPSTPSVASLPTFVTSPNFNPVMVPLPLDVAAASEPASDDETSIDSEKTPMGSDSPSWQSSVSIQDIEKAPTPLKGAVSPVLAVQMGSPSNSDLKSKAEALVPRHPILRRQFEASQRKAVESSTPEVEASEPCPPLCRRFHELQLARERNLEQLTLVEVGLQHSPYLVPGWGCMSLQQYFFNAAMLPNFADMRPSPSNGGAPVVSRSPRSPPIVYTPPVKALVMSAPMKTVADEPAHEAEIMVEFKAPLVTNDPSYAETEDESEEFTLFGSPQPLSEIDPSFSDGEDDYGHFKAITQAIAKKTKKDKVQANDSTIVPPLLPAFEADNLVPASEPTLFDNFNANVPRDADMKEIKVLGPKCVIGGALFIAGCAGIAALVGKMLSRK
ncbi:hypothetical protein E2P81_ATG09910 [Venturia nashicola]|nr:hypothetical protein E2P81_ATG09910 [Venturia nashicola]